MRRATIPLAVFEVLENRRLLSAAVVAVVMGVWSFVVVAARTPRPPAVHPQAG